jgi:hypothetical protein
VAANAFCCAAAADAAPADEDTVEYAWNDRDGQGVVGELKVKTAH